MRNVFTDIDNLVNVRNVYPEAGGPTVAGRASALTPYTAGAYQGFAGENTLVADGAAPSAPSAAGGILGRPLTWWLVLVVLLVALMWTAQHFGSEKEDFRSVRLSLYNILVISLAAMIGFGVFKAIFGRWRVPGLSDYVAAV